VAAAAVAAAAWAMCRDAFGSRARERGETARRDRQGSDENDETDETDENDETGMGLTRMTRPTRPARVGRDRQFAAVRSVWAAVY